VIVLRDVVRERDERRRTFEDHGHGGDLHFDRHTVKSHELDVDRRLCDTLLGRLAQPCAYDLVISRGGELEKRTADDVVEGTSAKHTEPGGIAEDETAVSVNSHRVGR
jgi:hypothetical protein